MILDKLKTVDPTIGVIPGNDGAIYLSPGLQGRIFCSIGDELMHKLDFELAQNPTDGFNNIGGNSLWPAPEGGAFAFNYPYGEWTVQEGINSVCPELTLKDGKGTMVKHITLHNAKGTDVSLEYKREVKALDVSAVTAKYGVKAVSYESSDCFTAEGEYSVEDAILNSWTLEQFWGAEGITAFGKFEKKDAFVKEVINDDFYGDPLVRIRLKEGLFIFALGGPNRLQIGVKKDCVPTLLGAYDPSKEMLIIRKTAIKDGVYINIADNDQKDGAYSTEDVYSVFNGSNELGFFELETIAPMEVKDGKFIRSELVSETVIYKGNKESLSRLLEEYYSINSKEIIK